MTIEQKADELFAMGMRYSPLDGGTYIGRDHFSDFNVHHVDMLCSDEDWGKLLDGLKAEKKRREDAGLADKTINDPTGPAPFFTETCLPAQWLEAKEAERAAVEKRRVIEDQLLSLIGLSETFEGTKNAEQDGYKVKIVGRMNRKVDSDALQDLAREHGLETFLTSLFKWEADLKLTAWKATDKSITDLLAPAIITKPGRPSFSIEEKEAK